MAETYTVQQRNAMFAQATRQNLQGLGKKTVNQGGTTVSFLLPKARFLSKVLLAIDIKFKLKHASQTQLATDEFSPYRPIRKITLDLNNGFSPFNIGGAELAVYNAIRQYSDIIYPQHESPTGYCYCPEKFTASTTGASNTMKLTLELATVLNDRDPIGLVLAQNNETSIELKVDIASETEFINGADGFSVEVESIDIKPTVESFSIPAVVDAYPDLSVLKLTNSRTEAFTGNGQNIINLTTGTIYRKLGFIFEDLEGNPFGNEDFTSNIDLVFNQADTNYSVPAEMLRNINVLQFGKEQPKGVYVFDFSYNGQSNYGGTRDYIDTAMLTMFQLRFNSQKSGRVRIITEQIARLV